MVIGFDLLQDLIRGITALLHGACDWALMWDRMCTSESHPVLTSEPRVMDNLFHSCKLLQWLIALPIKKKLHLISTFNFSSFGFQPLDLILLCLLN